jgi:hypothetical protein
MNLHLHYQIKGMHVFIEYMFNWRCTEYVHNQLNVFVLLFSRSLKALEFVCRSTYATCPVFQ